MSGGGPMDELRAALDAAVVALGDGAAPRSVPSLERPRQAEHGDLSSNAALLLAPLVKGSPRDVAQRLAEELGRHDLVASAEVAGPGFVNLRLAPAFWVAGARAVAAAGSRWGAGAADPVEAVDVEFVSANPTGPLHVGHARNAAYGDALARVLAFHGHDVTREYYVNDFGSQVLKFGASLQARARGEEVPEDGYRGEYVVEVAAQLPGAASASVEEVAREGVAAMLGRIERSLERFGVAIDVWRSERELHETGVVERGVQTVAMGDKVYDHEGATWLRTSALGDDKDRVLRRSDGEHTYFASDVGYLLDKRERGFARLVLVLGADHHGYIGRMKAAYAALGEDPERLELLIMQLVALKGMRMSKRAGDLVTLDDLVDEVGVDAARWFLLARSHDTAFELDLKLAREQSAENPVYYVQYAHARIRSILRRAEADGLGGAAVPDVAQLHPSETALVAMLLRFGWEVGEAAERRAPHRIAAYALELARSFTAFYRDCPVLGADGEGVEAFRLALCAATAQVLARSLDLLGVSAPDEM